MSNPRACRSNASKFSPIAIAAVCATLALVQPTAAAAQEGVEQHDGFMLRLALGFGYGSATEGDSGLGKVTLSGGAGFFSIDVGGAVTDNLVIHGHLSDMAVVSPTVSVAGEELGTAEDASITFLLYGVGLTYYLMPSNVYFTFVAGLAGASMDSGDGTTRSTNRGFGLEADIGKEWWVSDNWGLGIAGRFSFSSISEDLGSGVDVTLRGTGFGVLFSATYQ